MRRSSSSTHIPMLKPPESRSKSLARNSREAPSTTKIGVRTSSERLAVPTLKRTSSLTNFRTPTVGSSRTSNFKKVTGTTPAVGSTSYQRPSNSLVTPLSGKSRSRSRSPFKLGSDRNNDKKWASQQYVKVRRYLEVHCPEKIPEIKPPTISSFVSVMNLLLKEVDPKIEINTVNYKEKILDMLKTLHYPGNVSNSLLKTVNTMHAWPQVMCILGWLVDLVTIIKSDDLPVGFRQEEYVKYQKVEALKNYITKRYLVYNNANQINETPESIDAELIENLTKLLNIDEEETRRLESKVNNLAQLKEEQMKLITEQQEKNAILKEKIDSLQSELATFYESKDAKQEDLNCENASLLARKEKLLKAIKTKKESIASLTETIKKQPCTVQEKKRMLKHIDEMKHTLDLKKERIKQQRFLREECESKRAETKKKVETEVYRLNNSLMKLVMAEPELNILQLKEADFLSQQFANDIKTLAKNIQMFEQKFKTEAAHLQTKLPKVKKEISLLENQVETTKEQIQSLIETEKIFVDEIEKCNHELEHLTRQRKEHRSQHLKKMQELDESAANVDAVRRRLKEATEIKRNKEVAFDKLKEKTLEFFVKLHALISGNLMQMTEIRNDVFDVMEECMKKIQDTQGEIIKDLHNLDDLSSDHT